MLRMLRSLIWAWSVFVPRVAAKYSTFSADVDNIKIRLGRSNISWDVGSYLHLSERGYDTHSMIEIHVCHKLEPDAQILAVFWDLYLRQGIYRGVYDVIKNPRTLRKRLLYGRWGPCMMVVAHRRAATSSRTNSSRLLFVSIWIYLLWEQGSASCGISISPLILQVISRARMYYGRIVIEREEAKYVYRSRKFSKYKRISKYEMVSD